MRSLAPREHGAYGQLGFPLLTALCIAVPRLPGILFAAAAAALLLAHEPAQLTRVGWILMAAGALTPIAMVIAVRVA